MGDEETTWNLSFNWREKEKKGKESSGGKRREEKNTSSSPVGAIIELD